MADDYTVLDSTGATKTKAAKDLGSLRLADAAVLFDSANVEVLGQAIASPPANTIGDRLKTVGTNTAALGAQADAAYADASGATPGSISSVIKGWYVSLGSKVDAAWNGLAASASLIAIAKLIATGATPAGANNIGSVNIAAMPGDTAYATATINAADVGSVLTTVGNANLQPTISGTATPGSVAVFPVSAMDTATFEVSGAATAGPLWAEKSIDGGILYVQTGISQDGIGNNGNGLVGNFIGEINCSGATHVRIRAPAWTAGAVTVGMTATKNLRVLKVINGQVLQDPVTPTNKLAISPAGAITALSAGGFGALAYITTAVPLGVNLGTPPPGATGVRFYLKTADSVTFTISAAQPTVVPGSGIGSPITLANSNYDTTAPKFGAASLPVTNSATSTATALLATINSGTYTVEGWVKATTAPAIGIAIGGNSSFYIGMTSAGLPTAAYNLHTTGLAITGSTAINDGNWHWASLSVGAAGAKLLIDGAVVASNATAGATGQTATTFGVGPYGYNGAGNNWQGSVDEVAVWSTQQYTTTTTVPSAPYASGLSNMIGLFHFDQNGADSSQILGPPVASISGAVTGPNWDEKLSGQNIYVTGVGGTPSFRWY